MNPPEICNAIHNKKLLQFSYEGSVREVEPHSYGITSRGRECVNAFQVSENGSHRKFGWRMFDLRKMDSLTVLEKTFSKPRADYVHGGSGMKKVFCEL
ncbi:MAG TPA: WYL domain-containing protein [Chitinophagales bacterium]|nr:WYL domain-containing protein [Chitinophagales bacterium]